MQPKTTNPFRPLNKEARNCIEEKKQLYRNNCNEKRKLQAQTKKTDKPTISKHSRYKEPLQFKTATKCSLMAERTLSLVTCTSCGKPIPPGSESTKFQCPNCGEIQIKRDGKCRKFGRLYKCPKCGFTGP